MNYMYKVDGFSFRKYDFSLIMMRYDYYRYTAQVAESFGWERVCTIPFNQYTRNDEVIFKYIKEPHTEVQVYIDQITSCKDYYSLYKNLKKKTPVSKLPEKES